MLVLTAILGFFQEHKGEQALQHLQKLISFKTKVFRDESEVEVNSKNIVPGDVVYLELGDLIPADGRIIESNMFECDESSLTGESIAVEKNVEILKGIKSVHQQKNMVFMGTHVTRGTAKVLITGIGYNTEVGKTAKVLKQKRDRIHFEEDLSKFGGMLVKIIIILTIIVFAVNFVLGRNPLESLLFSLAIAVGITPEVLPVIITIGLSTGAIALSKKKVIVKRLAAIEELGNMDVLCCDKTGTLTENSLILDSFFDSNGKTNEELLVLSMLCNSAVKTRKGYVGNSIDVALMNTMHASHERQIAEFTKIDEVDFDFERKRMSVVVKKRNNDEYFLICKGSFDTLINCCTSVRVGKELVSIVKEKKELEKTYSRLSSEGFRVIALAEKKIPNKKDYSVKDEKDLCFLGFISFRDPEKKLAARYLTDLHELGVHVKIITGDAGAVTEEICKRLHITIHGGEVVEGNKVLVMKETELSKVVESHSIFVRASPEAKLKIVRALQKNGHVVGFLGDGINDSQSLKQADCGITVDSAADIARESADIILTQKSLFVIIDAIKDGRKTFANVIKYILNTISANLGNMITLTISSMFLPFIPLLPIQILLANFISDGPMLMISTDSVDEEHLGKPKKWSNDLIVKFMLFFGIISSVFDLITMAILLFMLNSTVGLFQTAWFLESVLSEILITFAIRTKKPFWKSKPSFWLILSSIIATGVTFVAIYSPINEYFSFVPLHTELLVSIFFILIAYFALVEIMKHFFFERFEI